MSESEQPQLELFQVPETLHTRRSATIGAFQVRYDHAVLMAIASLISVSVVFACGVERGKRLATEERLISPTLAMTPASASTPMTTPPRTVIESPADIQEPAPPKKKTRTAAPAALKPAKTVTPAPAKAKPKPAAPMKAANTKLRFAVQVVTYSKPQLAQHELQRLKRAGEKAFLLTKQGRVVVCIGPFPNKENATAKLANLKRQYQDCFVRTL
jgi:cell division septation protein DedD